MRQPKLFKQFSLLTIGCWLVLFALAPLALMLIVSFLGNDDNHLILLQFDWRNYTQLFSAVYFKIFWHSLWLAGFCALLCLALGYPIAFIIAQMEERKKNLLLILLIIPFWTSSLIRTYAILTLLKTKGLINSLLIKLGLIHLPLAMIYTTGAVIVGNVYNLLPFMVLPLYANIEKLDGRLLEAARDLGANRFQLFSKIIIPLTMPGIIAGMLLVLLPAMTLFYIPMLLGNAKTLLVGNLIENQFLIVHDWPAGSATSVTLTLLMLALIWFYQRKSRGSNEEILS